MQPIDEIQRKLFILRNYETVFRGETVRQVKPTCCGQELGLSELLKTTVHVSDMKINSSSFTVFEVICPICGQRILPQLYVSELAGCHI
ncbi:MAG: hypothetical protein WC156_06865 [Pedobacter sp.]